MLRARGVKFEWTHIGDGPDKQDVVAQASPLGDHAHFLGELPHDQVRAWLARNPIDVFCNVSESEGLPVTLMEAASCGIPLFATDVGGNNEIVDESVGRLIPGSAGPDLVADMLTDMASQSESTKHGWRRRSAQRWVSSFDAEHNYENFAEELLNVLREKCDVDQNSARLDNWKESF
jgi:glycosyltransferase involved in cell wall biosynthesis